MGLLSKSVSYVRFAVEGDLPDRPFEFIPEQLKKFSFRDIDDTTDEVSVGWVSALDMFDSEFRVSAIIGDYVHFALRIDERRIPAAVSRKYLGKEVRKRCNERGVARLARAERVEINEQIRLKLLARTPPTPTVCELCWDLANSELFLFNPAQKTTELTESIFKVTFGLSLMQKVPFTLGLSFIASENLENLTPAVFV